MQIETTGQEITLHKSHAGRYTVTGHGTDESVWVYEADGEWHVMRYSRDGFGTSWVATGLTRKEALELASEYGWK